MINFNLTSKSIIDYILKYENVIILTKTTINQMKNSDLQSIDWQLLLRTIIIFYSN